MSSLDPNQDTSPRWRKLLWVNSTYFAEGLPYMIVRKLSTVFFTDIGVDLKSIGYLNFLGAPWNFKFLWAPLLDILGTKRSWLVAVQVLIGLLVAAVALFAGQLAPGGPVAPTVAITAWIFVVMAFFAATNDVAIDAYYMEAIRDQREQAEYSGYRVLAYRVAVIFVATGLVAMATLSPDKGTAWRLSFGAGAVVMLLCALGHAVWLPRVERAKAPPSAAATLRAFGQAFSTYLQQERVAVVLAFIVTYKIGDEILFSMTTPFLMRELLVTKGQLAWISGVVGASCTVAGAVIGGYWVKRTGLRRAIWPMTLVMNLNIWAYVWLAWYHPLGTSPRGFWLISGVHGYEMMAAALGNVVLLVYLLRTCRPEFKAAHYAVGSAIMSLPSNLLGGLGGVIVEKYGYANFFIAGFVVALLPMCLLPWLPYLDEPKTGSEA